MSEFHPNRTKQVRTRPKLTLRRILECWPFLIWIAVAFTGYKIYRSGVVFVRMNGAVDVYQENVTPSNDGRLMEIKVVRGQRVAPGTVVAVMDSAELRQELETLRREIVADRLADARDYDSEITKLESEMRELQTQNGEDLAIIKTLRTLVEDSAKPKAGVPAELQRMMENDPDMVRAKTELAKAQGRNALNAQHVSEVTEGIQRNLKFRNDLQKEADLIANNELGSEAVIKGGALREDEYQQYMELKLQLDQCQLITTRGGTVDRVEKEQGEYVVTGESVLRVVGDPEQIVCFLPQDQASDLNVGDTVWVANTSNKAEIFTTKVNAVSPRINNLPDATSPLPNRRVHGRDVVLDYPPGAKQGDRFILIPGQTVIVHLQEPGTDNWLDTLIHNDDNEKPR